MLLSSCSGAGSVRGGRAGSLAASPTLVGAVTVLVVIVAVFLSYQANQGLPFVPTYKLSAQVPNANTMVPGNEVRIGGIRVGAVKTIEPVQDEDGSVNAKVDMELNEDLDPLPVDSTADRPLQVRPRPQVPGAPARRLRGGLRARRHDAAQRRDPRAGRDRPGLQHLRRPHPRRDPGEPDRVRQRARRARRRLNAAIGDLRPLVERLEPGDAQPRLGATPTSAGFVRGLSAAAAEVAPVAERAGPALRRPRHDLRAPSPTSPAPSSRTRSAKSPETEDAAIRTLPVIRPLLNNTGRPLRRPATRLRRLRPAPTDIAASPSPSASRRCASRRALNRQLDPTAQSLLDFNNNANVREGIDDLTSFTPGAAPALAYVGPAQSVCNYATLLFRNIANLLSLGDGLGTLQRFIVLEPPDGAEQREEPQRRRPPPAAVRASRHNYLHYNPYPNTASPGQIRECEAGNETYAAATGRDRQRPRQPGNHHRGPDRDKQLGKKKKKKKKKKK